MKLYLDNGYANIPGILDRDITFNILLGGRGTGKTFGALDYVLEHGQKFLLTRRTQTELDIINKEQFSPFKSISAARGEPIGTASISKYNSAFYHQELGEDGQLHNVGSPIGYTAALSTIAHMRGFDTSDVDLWLFDEFIPERHSRPIKAEAESFLNAYETINRNRELNGRPPVKVLLMANANDLGAPLLMELGLVEKIDRMVLRGQEEYVDESRGLAVYLLQNSPISEAKAHTALYKLTSGNDFSEMALENVFAYNRAVNVRRQPLQEFKPLFSCNGITVYSHKSDRRWYVSRHRAGSCPAYNSDERGRSQVRGRYYYIWVAYLEDRVYFEDNISHLLFEKLFKM